MRYAKFMFSPAEKVDLLKAWLATSIAFAVFFTIGSENGFSTFMGAIVFSALTAGVGFLGHELMHKWTASRFGVHSEFRSHDSMLIMSIIIAFLGVIFAAPGAVYMFSNISRRENGIISAAGPFANVVMALVFLPLAVFYAKDTIMFMIGSYGLWINALLATFNMIPFGDFDGSKILNWSKPAYFSLLVAGACLIMAAMFI